MSLFISGLDCLCVCTILSTAPHWLLTEFLVFLPPKQNPMARTWSWLSCLGAISQVRIQWNPLRDYSGFRGSYITVWKLKPSKLQVVICVWALMATLWARLLVKHVERWNTARANNSCMILVNGLSIAAAARKACSVRFSGSNRSTTRGNTCIAVASPFLLWSAVLRKTF